MLLISCAASKHSKSSVETAMQQYNRYILNMDADSTALLFTPDGTLANIAKGRDSIRKLLSSFKNVKVLSQASTTQFIQIRKDTAIQKGMYMQSDLINGKDTAHVKGEFTVQWQWMKNGWHIKHIETKPL